jgi:hypothetical protein
MMHTFFYSCQNPKMFDLMFEHLQQRTNLFSLEIGGASTSCIYAQVWMHLQRYVYQMIISNFLYESINVGIRNIRILISIVLLVLQSKRFRIFLYRRAKKVTWPFHLTRMKFLSKNVLVSMMMILSSTTYQRKTN